MLEEDLPEVPVVEVAADATPTDPSAAQVSLLAEHGFTVSDMVDDFGFDAQIAAKAFTITDEDALIDFALTLDDAWQSDVVVDMAAGAAVHLIKEKLHLQEPVVEVIDANDDARVLEALKHPAAKMQFTFIDDDEELRRVIEDGDFGAWRVFLHPEQQEYAERDRSGTFRVTGGAGTGKTVVLLHRARYLARQNPSARIVLTTFTRALAENLRRDLERLDPEVKIADHLGDAGVLMRGVDQIAAEIRQRAGAEYAAAATTLLGSARETTATPANADWASASQQAGAELPVALRSEAFFAGEYAQVVLPHRITTEEGYFAVRCPGRGVALDRSRRAKVWAVIEQMRKDQRVAGALGYGEIAAISAEWLRSTETPVADHVLVDEAQDLEPAKWQLLRALVAVGPNDLFIADDTHQRIYEYSAV